MPLRARSLKLKLFPFSLRGKAKEWLHSLPTDSIKTWNDLKEAYIKKYYPPVKILQNRNNILSFRQNENEDVAMAWDRIKLMLRTCHHMELMNRPHYTIFIMV